MKVLLINKFHYLKGGSETYYFGLGELLKKNGHEVVYFSMKDEKNVPCEQEKYFVENVDYNAPMSKVQMVKAGMKMLYSFEAKKKLEQLIKDEKPDIAHLNIFQSQLTASVVDVLYKYKIPMVYTMHDLKALCPCYTMLTHGEICERCINGNFTHCIKYKCMKDSTAKSILATMEAYVYRIRKTYQKLNLIITPSEFYKKKLEQTQITGTKIMHMKNFLPAGTEYTGGITVGNCFLYFGRLSKEKGLFTLIEAYKQANVDRELHIVGTGPIENEIKEKIKELKLTEKVKMLGYKTGKELKNIIENSLCIILPSEWYENGPYSIMEAQAFGKYCIVSNNGGLPEIVSTGKSGLVFSISDIGELAHCMKEIDQLDKKSLLKIERYISEYAKEAYSSKQYMNSIIGEYQKLLG